jgi:hypothetical protein
MKNDRKNALEVIVVVVIRSFKDLPDLVIWKMTGRMHSNGIMVVQWIFDQPPAFCTALRPVSLSTDFALSEPP